MPRLIYLIVLCFVVTVQGNFPEDPKPCKYGDSQCIVNVINRLFSEKSEEGDSGLNLVKLEPFAIDELHIQKGAGSPININLILTNNNLYGVNTTLTKSVRGFDKDLTKKHELHLFTSSLSMIGPYSISGKILILPITGKGISNFTYGKSIERNGQIYMKPVNFQSEATPQRIYCNFSNLFNGDKALGDNMNAFLNDNWEVIYNELRTELKDGLGKKFYRIIGKVFSKIPYKNLFVE